MDRPRFLRRKPSLGRLARLRRRVPTQQLSAAGSAVVSNVKSVADRVPVLPSSKSRRSRAKIVLVTVGVFGLFAGATTALRVLALLAERRGQKNIVAADTPPEHLADQKPSATTSSGEAMEELPLPDGPDVNAASSNGSQPTYPAADHSSSSTQTPDDSTQA